jgi:glutathione S-transferase
MADWIDVEEARRSDGLRLVLIPGIPSPWGEAAKSIFQIKSVPFRRVRQEPGGENRELAAWTGQTSAPVAAWNDERPRSTWNDILLLAERIAPTPALVPAAAEERYIVFGLAHELCGDLGLAWCRRLVLIDQALALEKGSSPGVGAYLAARYGYTPEGAEGAPARVDDILTLFGRQLDRQQRRGSRYLVGDSLTALDVYWATFAAILAPLSEELCAMPGYLRTLYTLDEPEPVLSPLLEHRDFIYREHLQLPVEL